MVPYVIRIRFMVTGQFADKPCNSLISVKSRTCIARSTQRRRVIEALEARVATLVNSLQNRVKSITLCVILNANNGKIVLVTLCIQIEWLFIMLSGVKLYHESDADSIQGTGARAPTFTNDWARGTESKKNKNKKVIKLY